MNISIPMPPKVVLEAEELIFSPSPQLRDWVLTTFISGGGMLYNPDHAHLADADIEFLWTNADYTAKMRTIVGTAEQPRSGTKWGVRRKEFQLLQWFDIIPDFLITIHGPYFNSVGNPERCALIEHELYHCIHKRDKYGMPAFSSQTGQPLFGIQGHDVEEFVGVVRRYGAEAAEVDELVRVANNGPEVARAVVDGACGICKKRVA